VLLGIALFAAVDLVEGGWRQESGRGRRHRLPARVAATAEECRHRGTAALALSLAPDAILALGDLQYEEGELANFQQAYHPTWGRMKASTFPVPGNHEYGTKGPGGYYAYWGARAGHPSQGYYKTTIGSWQVVALNSNIDMSVGSAQEKWLRRVLTQSSATCELIFMHHPRWSNSAESPDKEKVAPLVKAAYDHGVELMLVGHAHNYQRFAPLNPSKRVDNARGIVEFVVGTGGKDLYPITSTAAPLVASYDDGFGVLELRLSDTGWTSRFVPESGDPFTDVASGACHRRGKTR
jgi:acid phosphatase type 7